MIIGSTAMKYHWPQINKDPKDLDIIKDTPYKANGQRVEILENPILIEYYEGNCPEYIGKDELYTLKISHPLWSLDNGSWEKHVFHIQQMKEFGCKLIEPLFYKLFEYWEKVHGKRKTSNLEMSSEDFFNNALPKEYEHDYLHEVLIQHPHFQGQERPSYAKVLKDGAEVDVCQQKFNTLNWQEKFNLAFEEVAVMSFEPGRYPSSMYWKKKYHLMLKKFIISHAPIWEAVWILQNHKELSTPPFNPHLFLNQKLTCN